MIGRLKYSSMHNVRPTKKLPESRKQKAASKQHNMSISANLDKLVTAKAGKAHGVKN